MNYKIEVTSRFKKQAKQLNKKFPSLKQELVDLFDSLENNPIQGSSLGFNCYKIRLAVASKGKGKSGGTRIISHVQIVQKSVYMLSIYDKSDRDSLTNSELKELLSQL